MSVSEKIGSQDATHDSWVVSVEVSPPVATIDRPIEIIVRFASIIDLFFPSSVDLSLTSTGGSLVLRKSINQEVGQSGTYRTMILPDRTFVIGEYKVLIAVDGTEGSYLGHFCLFPEGFDNVVSEYWSAVDGIDVSRKEAPEAHSDSAISSLEFAIATFRRLLIGESEAWATKELGALMASIGRYDMARELTEKAMSIYAAFVDSLAIEACEKQVIWIMDQVSKFEWSKRARIHSAYRPPQTHSKDPIYSNPSMIVRLPIFSHRAGVGVARAVVKRMEVRPTYVAVNKAQRFRLASLQDIILTAEREPQVPLGDLALEDTVVQLSRGTLTQRVRRADDQWAEWFLRRTGKNFLLLRTQDATAEFFMLKSTAAKFSRLAPDCFCLNGHPFSMPEIEDQRRCPYCASPLVCI